MNIKVGNIPSWKHISIGVATGLIFLSGSYITRKLLNPNCDNISLQQNNDNDNRLFAISIGGKIGYIDKTGKIVINPQFDGVGIFAEGLAKVRIGDKYGYIDKTGKIVINSQFDGVGNFAEGLAKVRIGDKYGYIDKTGQYVFPPQFDDIEKFTENLAIVEIGGKWAYIDKTGKIIGDLNTFPW